MAELAKTTIMNKYSVSLSKEENELIFGLIGDQCQTLCTSFLSITITIELVGVDVHTGYLCLVKSTAVDDGYFLKLYSLEQRRLMWQLAVKNHMKFLKTSPTLVSYNDRYERTLTEFNFSSKRDAEEFYESISTVLVVLQLEDRKKRRTLRRSSSIRLLFQNVLGIRRASTPQTKTDTGSPIPTIAEDTTLKLPAVNHEIGRPYNFKHIVHGTDPVIVHTNCALETDYANRTSESQSQHASIVSVPTPVPSTPVNHEIGLPFNFKHVIHATNPVSMYNNNKLKTDGEQSQSDSMNQKFTKISLSTPDLLTYDGKAFEFQI